MTASDIVAFLTTQYDEAERAGRTDSPFAAAMDAAWPGLPECMTLAQAERRTMAALNAVYPYLDAKTMLADIAAKRKRLALHQHSDPSLRHCHYCDQLWPCLDVRLDAAPYADRPGYNPAWAVE